MDDLLSTAYHEAGHAVVDYDHGTLVGRVTIVPDPERGSAGSSQSEQYDSLAGADGDATEGLRARVVSLYAGLEAERLVDPDADEAGAGDDYEQVRYFADLAGLGQDALDALRREAAGHVVRRQDVIDRLARVLLDLRSLDQHQVEAVIEDEPFYLEDRPGSPLYTKHLTEQGRQRHEERAAQPKRRFSIPPLGLDE